MRCQTPHSVHAMMRASRLNGLPRMPQVFSGQNVLTAKYARKKSCRSGTDLKFCLYDCEPKIARCCCAGKYVRVCPPQCFDVQIRHDFRRLSREKKSFEFPHCGSFRQLPYLLRALTYGLSPVHHLFCRLLISVPNLFFGRRMNVCHPAVDLPWFGCPPLCALSFCSLLMFLRTSARPNLLYDCHPRFGCLTYLNPFHNRFVCLRIVNIILPYISIKRFHNFVNR